jgi:drug/metabolite transporter (DMT)-like permease
LTDRRIWLAISIAALGWGTGGPATRLAFDEGLEPYGLVVMRLAVATLALTAYTLWRNGSLPADRLTWKVGAVQGVGNLAVPYILFTIAYENASAGFVGLLAALIPLATAIFAHYLLPAEPMRSAKAAGLSVAFVGVAVLGLSGDSGLAEGGRPALALTLGGIAVIVISIAGIYAKHHAGSYTAIELTFVQFVVGIAVAGIAMFIIEGAPTQMTGRGWALVIYMGIASSFMPFALFYWLLAHTTITRASLVGYIVPIISVAAGVLFVDESLQAGIIMGGSLILAGVLLADRAERRLLLPRP